MTKTRTSHSARRSVVWLLMVIAMLASASSAPAEENANGGKRAVTTMTVNLYIGAAVDRIMMVDPYDPDYLTNLITAVTGVYHEVLVSQPPLRLQGVADRIAARMPDIVAVEEATLLRVQSPGDLVIGGTSPATVVVFDYLQILVNALEARGAHYAVVSTSQEWDIEMPMLHLNAEGQFMGYIDDVRQTDREAILVRTDLPSGHLRVSNPQSGHFAAAIEFPALGLSVTRGWCSVDAFIRGENFRFICAHLEQETVPAIQVAQVQELLGGPVNTSLPVVLVGDFNSDPIGRDRLFGEPSPYPAIVAAGFQDAWAVTHAATPLAGLTWGHDEFLAFPNVEFDRRIDFVFYRGGKFVAGEADVIDMPLGRETPPLWASDHAALAAKLLIK